MLSDLPEWVRSYRPHQAQAIASVMDAFDRVNVVLLDAPTGSGKTLIGETVRRMLTAPALYVCSSKMLQDQFAKDYPSAAVLKGRSNYSTLNEPNAFPEITTEDCTWSLSKSCALCPSKHDCPYEIAKTTALNSDLAVLNTSYLLTEANHVGKFGGQRFIIADEADTLESTMMNHVSVEISERRLERLGWSPPSRVTVEDSWGEWLDHSVADLRVRIARLPTVFSDVRSSREARYLTTLLDKLVAVRNGLPSGNWVYTGRGGSDVASRHGQGVSFRPARVDHLGLSHLWRHSHKWLLMSATIISSDEIMSSLGYDHAYETVRVGSTFPVENRQVFYRGATSMAFKNRENGAWEKLADAIIRDVERNFDTRILIHTVSYALTDYLHGRLYSELPGRTIVRYASAKERDDAFYQYRECANAVLLAPSMGRGIDLPDDLCRVQMICKCPFPYVKDRQINKRMYSPGGRLWYAAQTVRELVQMCGRAVRSETDWAATYIYDSDFETNLWARNRNLFPKWFQEAIIWRERA